MGLYLHKDYNPTQLGQNISAKHEYEANHGQICHVNALLGKA
jgi:hypothetical protein